KGKKRKGGGEGGKERKERGREGEREEGRRKEGEGEREGKGKEGGKRREKEVERKDEIVSVDQTKVVENVPDALAGYVPPVLLSSPTSVNVSLINKKSWRLEQVTPA
ncbi:hypothetical protein NFI96_008583, partial [Prochilodus magdalenae]